MRSHLRPDDSQSRRHSDSPAHPTALPPTPPPLETGGTAMTKRPRADRPRARTATTDRHHLSARSRPNHRRPRPECHSRIERRAAARSVPWPASATSGHHRNCARSRCRATPPTRPFLSASRPRGSRSPDAALRAAASREIPTRRHRCWSSVPDHRHPRATRCHRVATPRHESSGVPAAAAWR